MQLEERDYNLIVETLHSHYSNEELEESGVLDLSPDSPWLRKELAARDFGFFCRFYLYHYFSLPPAEMHLHLAKQLGTMVLSPGRMQLAIAWPRGFAKSTYASLGLPLWCTCFGLRKFIPIISDSHPQAKGHLAGVKEELEHNERIAEDFGSLKGTKWQEDDVETANGVKIIALGSGMKIRGRRFRQWRPDLIIVDDPEDLAGVQSETQRNGTQNWFYRSVLRAGGADTKTLVIGNFIHYACLVRNCVLNPSFSHTLYKAVTSWASRPDLWSEWRRILIDPDNDHALEDARAFYILRQEEMDDGAQSAWPEAFSYYDLMLMQVAGGSASFAMELMNDPVAAEDRLFPRVGKFHLEEVDEKTWIVPHNGRARVDLATCRFFGATDPSMGKDITSDPSALVIIAKAPSGVGYVIVGDVRRRVPDQIIRDQIRYAREYPMSRWGIEAVQFQAFYANVSVRESLEAGVHLPVVPVQQAGRGTKEMRIQSLQPDIENEFLMFNTEGLYELLEELEQAPAYVHDDGLDALEIAWRMAQKWENLIAADSVHGEVVGLGMSVRPGAHGNDLYAEMDRLARAVAGMPQEEYVLDSGRPGRVRDEEDEWYPVTFL